MNIVFQVSLERERQHDLTHVQSQLEKLDLLEQEYNKLTTMQALAEVSACVFLLLTYIRIFFFKVNYFVSLDIYRIKNDLIMKYIGVFKGKYKFGESVHILQSWWAFFFN